MPSSSTASSSSAMATSLSHQPQQGTQSTSELHSDDTQANNNGVVSRQSLEEYVDNLNNRCPPLPPSNIIHVPTVVDDQSSCASSITMAMRADDLFVPSIYPSLRTVENTTTDPPSPNLLNSAENYPSSCNSSSNRTNMDDRVLPTLIESDHEDDPPKTSVKIDNNRLRREKEKTFGKAPLEMNLESSISSTIELAVRKSENEGSKEATSSNEQETRNTDSTTNNTNIRNGKVAGDESFSGDGMINTTLWPQQESKAYVVDDKNLNESSLVPKMRESSRETNSNDTEANLGNTGVSAFARIMAIDMPMSLPNDTHLGHHHPRLEPTAPGAYPISAPGGNYLFRPPLSSLWRQLGDSEQHPNVEADQERRVNIDSDLVEARPVPSLQIATPQDEESVKRGEKGTGWNWFGFHRRTKVRPGMCIVAMAFIVLAAIVSVNLWTPDPTKLKEVHMRAVVIEAFGKDYFDNEQKERALRWMAFEDPQQSSLSIQAEEGQVSTNNHVIQRFSLVAFYFQSSFQNPWSFCTPPLEGRSSLCYYIQNSEVLRPTEIPSTRWLSAAHECEWMGVACTRTGGTKIVTELKLDNNNVTGTLPTQLSMLTSLQKLSFFDNYLSSTLPTWISVLPELQVVKFPRNLFTGRLPQEYFLFPKLTELSLGGNLLTGPLPVKNYTSTLEAISLPNNLLSGQFPSEIYSLTKLESLYLHKNNLTGSLSSQLGKLSDLTTLSLHTNQLFAGSIPSEIGVLKHLYLIYLQETSIEGSIPSTLYNLKSLNNLDLSGSKISGTISPRIGQLTKLGWFLVADTHLSGTIPKEISRLSQTLIRFHIELNPKLTGSIPNGYCLKRRQRLALGRVEIVADCTLSASTGGVPLVACPDGCCTSCCDAGTKICVEQ